MQSEARRANTMVSKKEVEQKLQLEAAKRLARLGGTER
jgi:hypothetical protein